MNPHNCVLGRVYCYCETESYALDIWEEVIDFHFDRPSVRQYNSSLNYYVHGKMPSIIP